MKYLLILLFASAQISLFAQLKAVEFSDKTASSENFIIAPNFKRASNEKQAKTNWSPKTLAYTSDLSASYTTNGRPVYISGFVPYDDRRGLSPVDQAMNYLAKAAALMHIQNAHEEWKYLTTLQDELGMRHFKFAQQYESVPIYGSEAIVHATKKGYDGINGRYYSTLDNINTTPNISTSIAEENTVKDLGGFVGVDNDKFNLFNVEPIQSKLVIYPRGETFHLAYHITVFKNIVERWEYFVDAHSGEVIHKHESFCKFHNHVHSDGATCSHTAEALPPIVSTSTDLFGNTQNINTYQSGGRYYMIDTKRSEMYDATNSQIPDKPVGTIWTLDAFDTSPQKNNFKYDNVISSTSNFPNKNTAVSAHINGGKAYAYFKNRHNRISINGQGGNIISIVNVSDEDGSGLDNAFWSGIAMFYGNGKSAFAPLARGLDVAGHEMTHGVVQSTANLEYQGESGALNESFADVFGSMIDRDDWLIGEDVVNRNTFPSGALRSMKDPHNGGSRLGQPGYQPRHYNERYQGREDNGGVHINSGIPNYAFYLFATNSAVGKDKAEKVYYRALTNYLTKSSQFADARAATIKAAQDLYDTNVVNALKNAWNKVGVGEGSGSGTVKDYEKDVNANPGSDLIAFTVKSGETQNNIYISTTDGKLIADPATLRNPISKPSITDDGSEIIYVTDDRELGYLVIDWQQNRIVRDTILSSSGNWRNAVFSKDGLRLAALKNAEVPEIFVYDFVSRQGKTFELFNPTYTQGVQTGTVKYADAMEFDFTGEYILYDANNAIKGAFNDIEYWDIGFIKVWDNATNQFSDGKDIQKLFSGLPEGVSVGNPTFSKNSPYIIAFDYLEKNEFSVRGANIEKNKVGTIYASNDRPGYPSYSKNDDRVIFDAATNTNQAVIGVIPVAGDKINSNGNATALLNFNAELRWGVWFSNGKRVISSTQEELLEEGISVYPNPTTGIINIESENDIKQLSVSDIMGRTVYSANSNNIDISHLPTGQYILSIQSNNKRLSTLVNKF